MNTRMRDWAPFLVIAFLVLGMLGAYATYAAQIPLERAAARSAALSAEATKPGADLARIDRARADAITEFRADAEATGFRLRFAIAGFTVAAALFGVAVLGVAVGKPRNGLDA